MSWSLRPLSIRADTLGSVPDCGNCLCSPEPPELLGRLSKLMRLARSSPARLNSVFCNVRLGFISQ